MWDQGRAGSARWDLLSIPSAAETPSEEWVVSSSSRCRNRERPWRQGAGIRIGELHQPFVEPEVATGHVCQTEFLLDAPATGVAHAGA